MISIAKEYKFSFELEYEESGCLIFGAINYDYETNKFMKKELDDTEWVDYEDDEGNVNEEQNEELYLALQNKDWEVIKLD